MLLIFTMTKATFQFLLSILFFFIVAITISCNSPAKNNGDENQVSAKDPEDLPENNLKFEAVNGVRFYEVKRRFRNGLSFNKDGFQQVPSWIIEFKAPDTMLAYSPEIQGMESFYLHHDHARVYNFAREFFRVRTVSKDSLILQRLEVRGMKIAGNDDPRSDVYSTYYSKKYIENILKSTVGELQRPTRADTTLIKEMCAKTYKDPGNPQLAFPAKQPVVFVPNSKNVTVEKISTADETNNRKSAVDYFYPFYKIQINKSYKNFAYTFSVVVDAKGKMYVTKGFEYVLPEYKEQRKQLLQGIADTYLFNLFNITPGKTLDIPHSSEISLTVIGKIAP